MFLSKFTHNVRNCLKIFPIIHRKKVTFAKRNTIKGPIDTNTMTLIRFLIKEQKTHPFATGAFTELIISIQTAIKIVDVAVRKAGITHLFGMHGTTNVHGEQVKKLDVLANELFINMLSSSYAVDVMVSEEDKDVIEIPKKRRGKYIICYDPLDGSSNIDCLVSIGSIFGIYGRKSETPATTQDILQPGRTLVAAGYALYGSATVIIFTSGRGVNGFMLDHASGEFLLTDRNIQIPKKGSIYSINEGYQFMWDDAIKKYIADKKDPNKGKPYALRYIGSMVADVHRTLKYGGIFLYPATTKSPQGKLRLLYECNPMSFIIEQAGGAATDGEQPILDIVPSDLHHRSPIFCGSPEDVDEFMMYFKKYKKNEKQTDPKCKSKK